MPNHERMATWWMHWPDLQWPDSDNLDRIKARAEGMAQADVTAAVFLSMKLDIEVVDDVVHLLVHSVISAPRRCLLLT